MNPDRMPREVPHPNLVALCQVCHLRAQHWTNAGSFVSRDYAIGRLQEIIEEDSRQGDLPL
jgi:5-methylcytosine-specific restriction endonuclease McrA